MAVNLYRLRMAITGAFVDQASLAMAVQQSGHDLTEITSPGSLNKVVFELLRTANKQGWLKQLLQALKEAVPGNQQLQQEITAAIAEIQAPGPTKVLTDRDPEFYKSPVISPLYGAAVLALFLIMAVGGYYSYPIIAKPTKDLELKAPPLLSTRLVNSLKVSYRNSNDEEVVLKNDNGVFAIPWTAWDRSTPSVQIELDPKMKMHISMQDLDTDDLLTSAAVRYKSISKKEWTTADGGGGEFEIPWSDWDYGNQPAIRLDISENPQDAALTSEPMMLARVSYRDPRTIVLFFKRQRTQ